jgi:pyrroline-5-carboxylate reductase
MNASTLPDAAAAATPTEPGTVGFLGAGHMGGAMLRGLAAASPRTALRVFDAAPGRAEALAAETGAVAAASPADLAAGCDAVVLAVRPGDLPALLESLGAVPPEGPLFLSIAAGRTTAWIEARLPAGSRVVRAMPNLGVSVGLGMTAYAPGARATEGDLALAGRILSSFGKAIRLPEPNLDAVTALSGSGPAFFACALQAMADGGAALGLDPAAAATLALQTMLGTATVLSRPGAPSVPDFIAAVATKGGTTAAGKDVLDASDLRDVYAATLAAAARRASELAAQ